MLMVSHAIRVLDAMIHSVQVVLPQSRTLLQEYIAQWVKNFLLKLFENLFEIENYGIIYCDSRYIFILLSGKYTR